MLKIDAASSALVIVDMQNDYCSNKGVLAASGRDISKLAAAVRPVVELLTRARQNGMTVVFTRLVQDSIRGTMEMRHNIRPRRGTPNADRLKPGSWGSEVVDELAPRPGEIVIDKLSYSAFTGTSLEGELRERGIKAIILAGVVTYACVLATAFDAYNHDFDVVLVTDAVGSWNDALGTSTTEIVDLLLGAAIPADQIDISPRQQPARG